MMENPSATREKKKIKKDEILKLLQSTHVTRRIFNSFLVIW